MSHPYRQRMQGPWRDRYYPYDTRYSHYQANNETTYDYGYGGDYDYGNYYGPSSSQSDNYSRNYNEDNGPYQYSYPVNERQDHTSALRYYEDESYRGDHYYSRSLNSGKRWDGYRNMARGSTATREFSPKPYHHKRNDRPVTPPPPQSPSPTYIKLAKEPPQSLPSSSKERKLLVLDLNGTLVHRSALSRPKDRNAPIALDNKGRPLPRLRPVHPRPYMNAFRSYLFAPETRAWLDVMIWSSAQPHSVADMVERCFGSDKDKLLVVWARDTLGLKEDHYCTSLFIPELILTINFDGLGLFSRS